jgi:hypothetical protein
MDHIATDEHMTEIRITYNAREVDDINIGMQVHSRFLGAKGRALVIFSFVLPMLAGAILVHNLTSMNMWADEVLVLLFLLYASIICWIFAQGYNARKLRQLNDQAWYRQLDLIWVLNSDGCTQEGAPLWPWSEVTNVHYFKKMTVIDFAVRRIVVLPDAALPDGTTPAILQAQIAEWRHI